MPVEDVTNLIKWIDSNSSKIESYIFEDKQGHLGLWGTRIIENIINAIRKGDKQAIELGCKFIVDDRKVMFGKALKSSIASALKKNPESIGLENEIEIIRRTLKLINLEYTPTEVKHYCKLISKFGFRHCDMLLEFVPTHNVANNYREYLVQKCCANKYTHLNQC